MSPLRHARNDDLALRPAMGCQWSAARTRRPQLVECLDRPGHTFIPTAWAVGWATPPQHVQPAEWARRLRWVRGFAPYHSALDPRRALPPTGWLPCRPPRHSPSCSSDAEIAPLLDAARHLPSSPGLRAHSSVTVCGVLVVTGMRSRALVRRDHRDVALDSSLRPIRPPTLRTSRGLPLPRTTQQARSRSVGQRDRVSPLPQSPSLFVSEPGRRFPACTVRATCIQLSRPLGLRRPPERHGPR
jgi:integrase/recombinase XerD